MGLSTDYYTFRAGIYQSYPKHAGDWRQGKDWVMPAAIEEIGKNFLVNKNHKYYAIVFGLTRDGEEHVVNMASSNHMANLIEITAHYPATIIYPLQEVRGKLAPRYGYWCIESLPSKYRGVMYPRNTSWVLRSRAWGGYRAMKQLLHEIQINELRTCSFDRPIHRLVPFDMVKRKRASVSRKYYIHGYDRKRKINP